ncbi:sacsin isoform X4 [Homo sapiens]|uniref:sacsin isoform X4 n=1 Tax=Homo sapiens TaxID=9606 RepID=UPI0005D01650|nr:sacsin isoform X4 [Homo sapiens]XP_054230404.1 sacsin isoform X4 [Homo sapiens]|eukprot:XP_011533341.1 sacsin isoform X2 [Homo sapiens]
MWERWVPVTVLPGCVGCRTVAALASWTVRDVKERIFAETGFPVSEQRLWRGGRELSDWIKIGDLTSKNCHLFVNLQSKGLKGGGRFGQTTPPLVDFLKDILRRYPEGGQILKELIQNAEDAGATEVKFLYDETQYGTETLWSKDMAPYQGPALYVYNNAVFTPEDWHGIQEIARSRKKDDPLKVGRFGIGFNSVYHITDVPCIFSGDQIGMLDPHQTLFGPHESGQCWNLKDDSKEISELSDQFAPFVGIFGSTKETFINGNFPGTFFRFPLRLQPSQLSSNLYNKQKVLELFESFRADADTVLLFLKSVQDVSLYVREADGTEKLVFRVTSSESKALKHERPNSIKILGTAISNYCKKTPSNNITCVTYHVNIVLEEESTKDAQKTSWLVCNSVGGRGISSKLDSLADELKFVPIIGIAMPLSSRDDEAKGATSDFSGKAFCFLPLPPGEESSTGLPVHISGFFGLTDNRRSIKWRELDQWRDPAALWNEFLVMNVVPKAYATLILDSIKRLEMEKSSDFPLSVDVIYKLWPEASKVKVHWQPVLEPLFSELLQNAVIYSISCDWVRLEQVYFSELDENLEYTKTVLNYLQSSGKQIAKVPGNVDAAVQLTAASGTTPVRKVTPAWVRQVLRKCAHLGCAEEKLHLLEFVLSDQAYSELLGLELLPLQNGNFVPFSSSVSDQDVIYITSAEYPRSLFPSLEGRFILDNLKPHLVAALKEAAQTRAQQQLWGYSGRPCTQLQLLNPERFARLIKEVMNTFWPGRELIVQWYPFDENRNHPSVSWLKMVWKNLYIHFSEDLTLFDEMPLIPRTILEEGQTCVELIRLRIPSLVILDDESEAQLPEFLADIVQKLGGFVLKKLDASIQHPLIKKYIHSPLPSAVLQIMEKMPLQKLCNQITSLLPTHKDALRKFLASLTDSSEKEKRIIQELAIFKRINHSSDQGISSYTKLKGCKVLHHTAKLPADLRLSISVIDSSDEATIRLANMLKIEQLKTTSCLKLVLKDIENAFYSHEEVTQLMLWVLENLSSLKNENPNVLEWLTPLKFIQISQEQMVSAGELFDPDIEVLKDLFCNEEGTYFPPSVFTSPDILHSLRQIGLKNEASLKEKDVVQVAKKIEALQVGACPDQDVLLKKAKTLLLVLNKNHTLLQSSEGKMTLKKIKWVPACKERPPNYPGSLVWKGDLCNLCAPPDMCDVGHAILIGSSLPLVESIHVNLEKALGIFTKPSLSAVLKHFKIVVDWYSSKTFSDEDYYQFQHILLEIYGFMHDHLNEGKDSFRALKFPWVWTGKKFCPLAQAVIKPIHDLDLQPYLHNVPKTMAKFHQLFKVCGSIEELTSDHISMVIQKIYLKSDQDLSEQESKQNLHLMLNIIRWLYSNQIPASPNTPVPIHHSKNPSKLIMKPIHECCYCDIKVDDLNDLLEDSVEPIILVHEDIPMKTAEWLKVPCLSTRLINPENMGFEQSGQREPLTVRIKNILEEYPSVSDIFKELLQNADDANATECSFLIDMRRNMDIRENLLDPGMAACHGPALWSFNNSQFSDSDFVNITRLGESLKRGEVDKVGKFGLGFNSVYHITDIPIIMSREFMIMFDPNINHISKHIKDKSNPGIKINWSKQQKRLRKFPNQFKPFIDVFGCQLPLTVEAPYSYNGTLFRLSFRTQQEAKVSEVSSTCYNTADIYSLVDEFSLCGHRLIIFTQSVKSMYLKYLKIEETNPSLAQDTVIIKKKSCSSKALNTPVLSVLKEAAKLMKTCSSSNKKLPSDEPKSSCILQITVEEFHHVFRRIADLQSPLFRGPDDDPAALFEMAKSGQSKKPSDELSQKTVECTTWLLCTCMDTGEALKFSLSESGRRLGLVPCGAVGVQLSEIQDQKWTVKPHIGEVFCYLPLRIKTGLPVHINGCFAVTSNRKEIWKTDTKGRWNTTFMRHVIVKAYLQVLSVLRDLATSGELMDYTYYAVWPDPDLVHDDFSVICQGFYEDIAHGKGKELTKVFSDGSTWVSMKNVRFLDDSILKRRDVGSAAFKIFLKYLKKTGSKNLCAVELPSSVKLGFEEAGCKQILLENTFSEKQFFSEVFFPNIQEIEAELRDPLMIFVLNEKVDEFSGVLRVTPCIPCSLEGHPLVLPSRLIHPEGRVAKLFDIKDGRFPYGSTQDYLNPIILIKLVQLGMAKDDILWDDMLERAVSVAEINKSDHVAACLRSSILLSLIDEKLKIRDPRAKDFAAKYQTIRFLPFLTKPAGFSLDWKGNSFKPETMFAATDLYTAEHQDIVCLLQPILNENSHSFRGCGSVSLAVKEFLGLLKKPTVDLVINQLKEVAKSVDDGITLYQENITNACYKYLHEALMQNEITKMSIIDKLKPFSFILVENAYVDSEKVSFHLNFEAAPYLYQLPNKYKNNFRELFETVGVRQSCTVEDFALVLESIDQERGTKQITEENFQLCRRIISEGIWSLIREKKQEFCEKNYGKILLPDTNLMLLPAKSLCYNDCPWIKVKDTTVKYCHADIPREVAVKLGAVPKRHKALERYASNVCFTTLGTEFGQKEKLTSRIKSILNAYPSEKEMLKELLQNADDAKATEICFVFDPRQHPVDRIFDDKWAPLQGPALCVYNNQPFTEDDVRGIQNLGKGTKEGNPYKTGQYGIGFNSVYHITDCPSFISGNDILCIFDPHARYAPGATSISPGRMFRDLDADFRTQFSDVLDLYLGTHFKLDNCTMFRFPLRNAEMAKVSEISSVPASDRMVQNLLDKLRSDGAELLMFLNHMEKISICEIDKSTGALNVLYSVKGKITDGDRLKRKQFHASVIDSVTKKRQLKDIPVQQITYTMDTEDSEGNLTTWLICNRSGFSSMEKVSKSVISAHKNQDITLFPRGGVAACITHNYKKPHRAFCFLPLSLETGLPFHVNGHFALDSARRNLWRDDNGVGVRSDWNNSLMTALIAPAYVELLIQLKKRYFPGSDPTLSVLQNTPIHVVKDTLKKFLSFFPVNRLDLQPDLYCLVKALYNCIHEDMKRLLPVVRAPNIDGSDLHSAVIITWINMSTSNKTRPFFDNLLQDELQHLKNADYNITTRKTVAENVYRLKHLLLEIGFNLVYNCDETANLYHCLIDADIPVSYVTPADIRSFLMTFSSPDTNCHIGKLPCRLQQTNLKLFHSLKLLVDYCFKDAEENEIEVEGLPLLITLDSVLQTFDAKRPKFLTTYHELIPSRKDLFMNTLYLKYSNILLNCKVAKVFDISSFADLLSSVLPREYKTKSCTKWKDNFASESWLKNAWHFISESVSVKEDQEETKPTFDIVVDTLKDWALLPGTKFTVSANQLVVPEGDVLLPLSLMHIAVFPNAQSDKVFHALMKAGCIQLALNKICSKDSAFVPLLSCHTANIESPTSILKALHYMVQTSTFRAEKLVENDFEALLMYFNCNLNHLMSQDDIKILKSLPCYKSISGRYVSIGKFGTCYVLTKSIPSAEVEKWTQSSSSAFLEEKIHLKELYEVIGCVPVDDLEVYLKHLLPKIENLSYDAKLEHLIYLKNRLSSAEELSEIKEQLFEKLESLLIIHDANSRLKQAKHFYDRTVRVFEVMLPEKLFIPNDFFKKLEQLIKPKNHVTFMTSWVEFLRNIGLKYILSQQQLLQFAKEISVRANTENWSKETLQNTVDILLHHIFQERMDLLSGNFLKELSLIPFLCPERAPAEFIRFHPQYQEVNGTLPLIKFNGAQVNPKFKQCDVLQLLWTSCPILPEKATPLSIKEQEGSDLGPQEQLEQVLNMLNVNLDPPLDKVINNCRNICNITTLDEEMVKTRAKVLRSIYEFLSAEKREFRFQLRGVAFVMVEDGWKLLKPEEVVINLEYESDFKPYLYKLPLELGTFHQLFKHLGTEDIISTKQYVEVLSRIFKNSEGKQLDPNEMRTVKRVVSGLFRSLQNDSVKVRSDLENVRDLALYLPSQDGRLVKSSILVFDDAPHYKSRIQGNIGVQMLVDLSQCYLGKDHGFHTKLIMLFPQKLRPRLLSSILEEQLDEETPKVCQFGALCSLQGRLQLLLSSEQFITGLIRIMKHENDNAFLANEEKAIRLCKALREGLKVSCFEKLQTTLRVKGFNPIPHSRSETFAFLKRFGNAVILLYIQHSDSKDINFLLALAMTLKSATDNLISDTSYLIAMLGCNDIYRIGEKLDSLGVKYDSSEPSKLELPMPGTPIPAEIHYTLLMDPMNVFYPGEYVGYLVDAEGGDIYGSYQPTYTYAIIVQEVEREDADNSSFLGKIYQIDIGYSEYKIVSSLDLYKFSRPEESSQSRDSAPSTPTSPTEFLTPGLRSIPPLFSGRESHKTSSKHQSPKKLKVNSLPEILKEVTSVVEQAWKLPESERKKIIRRLYLKWHPDKNPENHDIANEVFKHLQNEINRLEKQAFLDQNADRASRRTFSTSASRFQSDKYSFQRFYTSWNQEATSHKSERQQQNKEKCPPSAGQTYSQRFFVPPTFKSVGNPVEARRWLRQARANFSAARNDLHKNANEWVCFKCYLSTKLALIAADYAVRGKSDKDVKPTALAQKIEEYSQQLEGLTNDVHTLEAYGVDSLKTRYPDLLPFPQIPNDRFTSEVAMRVMECTACIIIKLENFMQQKV